jgi:hypothetical protein
MPLWTGQYGTLPIHSPVAWWCIEQSHAPTDRQAFGSARPVRFALYLDLFQRGRADSQLVLHLDRIVPVLLLRDRVGVCEAVQPQEMPLNRFTACVHVEGPPA